MFIIQDKKIISERDLKISKTRLVQLMFLFMDTTFQTADKFTLKAGETTNSLYGFTKAGLLKFSKVDFNFITKQSSQVEITIYQGAEIILQDKIFVQAEIQGGKGVTYTAGQGIKITDDIISVNPYLKLVSESKKNSSYNAKITRRCQNGTYDFTEQGLYLGNGIEGSGGAGSALYNFNNATGIYTSQYSFGTLLSLILGDNGCFIRGDFIKFLPRTNRAAYKSQYYYLTPKIYDGGTVTNSYTISFTRGNIHRIATTANTDCIITAGAPFSTIPQDLSVNNGWGFRLIVDNTAGVDVVFKQQVIISHTNPHLCYVDFQYMNDTEGYKIVYRYDIDLMRTIN